MVIDPFVIIMKAIDLLLRNYTEHIDKKKKKKIPYG